jgi:Trypsin-like peptidase domain
MLWVVCTIFGQTPAPPAPVPAPDATARGATVRIYNATKDTGGSGVVIGRSGAIVYVLTAAHVVEGADRVEIHVVDSENPAARPRTLNGDVAARTSPLVQDLALLRLKAGRDELPFAVRIRAGPVPAAKDLDGVQSVGCATARRPVAVLQAESLLDAPMVRKAGADESARFWRCRGLPAIGRSGGALLHRDGSLIGVCSGEDGKAGYYTHLDEIQRFLKRNGLSALVE